jgi:hypothetical protein
MMAGERVIDSETYDEIMRLDRYQISELFRKIYIKGMKHMGEILIKELLYPCDYIRCNEMRGENNGGRNDRSRHIQKS